MNSFLLALQFLTIIPIGQSLFANDKELGYSTAFYPIVGLIIGCILALSSLIFNHLSIQIQSSLILIIWVLITGGLHLDGLADCADAWVGGLGNRQRSLDIMKDPAAGPVAVATLILTLLLKWSIISLFLEQQNIIALILTPMLGRIAILILMLKTQYIRKSGLAEKIVSNLPIHYTNIVCILGIVVGIYFLGWVPIAFMLMILLIIAHQAKARLGGMTGDVYGAAVELVESVILLGIAI